MNLYTCVLHRSSLEMPTLPQRVLSVKENDFNFSHWNPSKILSVHLVLGRKRDHKDGTKPGKGCQGLLHIPLLCFAHGKAC
jgi:hypothetical protein